MSFSSKIHPYNTSECQSQNVCSASLFIYIDLRIHRKSTSNEVHRDHAQGSSQCRCAADQLNSRGGGDNDARRCRTFTNSTRHSIQETHPLPKDLYHGNSEPVGLCVARLAEKSMGKDNRAFIKLCLTFTFPVRSFLFSKQQRGHVNKLSKGTQSDF